jgi:hypothetical protein
MSFSFQAGSRLRDRDVKNDKIRSLVEHRQIPIRAVLEEIRKQNNTHFTRAELDLIDELLYCYG